MLGIGIFSEPAIAFSQDCRKDEWFVWRHEPGHGHRWIGMIGGASPNINAWRSTSVSRSSEAVRADAVKSGQRVVGGWMNAMRAGRSILDVSARYTVLDRLAGWMLRESMSVFQNVLVCCLTWNRKTVRGHGRIQRFWWQQLQILVQIRHDRSIFGDAGASYVGVFLLLLPRATRRVPEAPKSAPGT